MLIECLLGAGTLLDAGEVEIKQADVLPVTHGAYILVLKIEGE